MYERYVKDSDGRIWMQDKWGDRIYEDCYGMISHFMKEDEKPGKVKSVKKKTTPKPKKKSVNKILLLLAA